MTCKCVLLILTNKIEGKKNKKRIKKRERENIKKRMIVTFQVFSELSRIILAIEINISLNYFNPNYYELNSEYR